MFWDDEPLQPTQEVPIKAPEQRYLLPPPVMHAEAERELDASQARPYPAPTGTQSGPVAPEDLNQAVGHYADYGPVDITKPLYSETENIDQRKKNGAFTVAQGYGDDPNKKEADPYAPLDLSSAEDRIKFLNGFTQDSVTDENGNKDPNSKNMCGPTSLIGGAILADGPKGVVTLLDAVDRMSPGGADDEQMMILRAKLDPANPQPLCALDLQNAQKYIYERMNKAEGLDVKDPAAMAAATESQRGIDTLSMQKLMQESPELSKMYKDNNMEIAGIDVGGANGMQEDHAVLKVNDTDGNPVMVFDPGQRKNGQVTGRPEGWDGKQAGTINNGLADYEYARRGGIRGS